VAQDEIDVMLKAYKARRVEDDAPPRMKCAFLLESLLESKLDMLRKELRVTRSELVNALIWNATRHITISYRGRKRDSATCDDGHESPSTLTAA